MPKTNRGADKFSQEELAALKELIVDYQAAATTHVPDYHGGGISRKIAEALIRAGWRKKSLGA